VISNFALSIIDSNFAKKWGIFFTCSLSICIPPWMSSYSWLICHCLGFKICLKF
jgi:hypothetical protein